MPNDIKEITGIEVKERISDSVLKAADEVVNIDLTALKKEKYIQPIKSSRP